MENTTTPIAGKVSSSAPTVPLAIKILLDGVIMYENAHITQPTEFAFDVQDDEGQHELQFVMSGKTQQHTVVDDQGNITQDAMLSISDVCFDGIDITQIITENAVYVHDFNGTQAQTQDRFFGDMGCNGTVSLKFSTPFYLWLIENM